MTYNRNVMHTTPSWFEVDHKGLAKLREGTPKSAIITELVQNVWDTNATYCKIELKPITVDKKRYRLIVEDDDSDGFANLSHAYTLFAESGKKGDAEKRGRFNLGEKLVLAMCIQASIESTTGTIVFHKDGSRTENRRNKTRFGSRFEGEINLTRAEYDEIRDTVFTLLCPPGCMTTFNEIEIPLLTPMARFEATLPTVIGDDLRPSKRKCLVEVYMPQYKQSMVSDKAMVYEMGIPVVESGDKYHYNVLQKVPLTLDRTNVTPAFLRAVREAVAQEMLHDLDAEDANASWVREAVASPTATRELVTTVFEHRFGKDAVVYDPSDKEANMRAMGDGKIVVYGSQMSKEEWANVRAFGIAPVAGRVYKDHKIETSIDGQPWTPVQNVTTGMNKVAYFTHRFASHVLNGTVINIEFVSEPMIAMGACYGGQTLRFNVGRLGYAAFVDGLTRKLLDLIIHELAHEKALNHLSDEFHEECTRIGTEAVLLALDDPRLFKNAGLL